MPYGNKKSSKSSSKVSPRKRMAMKGLSKAKSSMKTGSKRKKY